MNEWLFDPAHDWWYNPASGAIIWREDMPEELMPQPQTKSGETESP